MEKYKMSKIKQTKIPMELTEENILKIAEIGRAHV